MVVHCEGLRLVVQVWQKEGRKILHDKAKTDLRFGQLVRRA